jgi:Tfp pilus assembly protein PilF
VAPTTAAQFRDFLQQWRKSGKPEDYVDILDAGVASGSRSLVVEASRYILRNAAAFVPAVVARANHIMFGAPTHVGSIRVDDEDVVELQRKIASLKKRLMESPRNTLAHVEIARLYSRLAQPIPAEEHLRIALTVSPNDRFALRAATRFFTMVGEPALALNELWKAPALASDPWLQSAELASAMLAKRNMKKASKAAEKIERKKAISIEFSELAAGWATHLELGGASTRKVLKTLTPTLQQPTENALAQGVWLTDHVGKDFADVFPKIHIPSDAYEARAMAFTEQGDFVRAEQEANKWVADQPFQVRSFSTLAFLRFVHLKQYEAAQQASVQGLILHPDDWTLLNYATISSALAGNIPRAEEFYRRFEKVATADNAKAFLMAAHGMLQFSKGNFREGVRSYFNTVRWCRRKNLPQESSRLSPECRHLSYG